MTYNVYIGADIDPLLTAITPQELLPAVGTVWNQVQASNIPFRAGRIAQQIAMAGPALAGLQEVAQWSTGPTQDANNVQFDFLRLILHDLAADGAHYRAVAVNRNIDASAPTLDSNSNLFYVRLVDRDVLLARTDLAASQLKITKVKTGSFSAAISFFDPALNRVVTIPHHEAGSQLT